MSKPPTPLELVQIDPCVQCKGTLHNVRHYIRGDAVRANIFKVTVFNIATSSKEMYHGIVDEPAIKYTCVDCGWSTVRKT